MRFALMIEAQQGLSYADQLALARRAEDAGYGAFFRSDHYQSFPGPAGERTTDAWAVLAGLARETSRIHLGALVSPVTFRHAGNFAKVTTTVDEMSGGRMEVGLGAGWNEIEHSQLGLPFPSIAERGDMLEENLAVLHGLWGEPDGWSFDGKHVSIRDAQFHPKPVDSPDRPRTPTGGARPRIIVGGEGSPRSMRIAARFADEFNLSSSSPQTAREKFAKLDEVCAASDRKPTLTKSAMVGVLIGRDAAEVSRRQSELLAAFAIEVDDDWFATRSERWILGTPVQARTMVKRFADAGVERLMLQDFLPHDLEMVDLMAEVLF